MAKYLLAGENINWLAIMALITFVIIFSLTLFMVIKRGSDSYKQVAELPLNDDTVTNELS